MIDNFVATMSGTYYVRVTGDNSDGTDYSLVVTRNADFDTESNDSMADAQDLIGSGFGAGRWVVGAVEPSPDPLFAIDSSHPYTIQQIDPQTGAIVRTIPSPIPVGGGPDGLAFDGQHLFLVNAYYSDDLYEIDATTGALESDTNLNSPGYIDGVAALGGKVYVSNSSTDQILEFDPTTDTVTRVLSPGVDLGGGLAGITGPNALIATVGFSTVVEIDPITGSITHSFNPGLGTIYGVATSNDSIYLGSPYFSGIDVYTRDGQFSRSLPYPPGITAMGGDGVGGSEGADYYRISADAFAMLTIATKTPASQSGEFVNNLDPIIRLYDSAGNLVASNDNGAADGVNASLSYRVPAGKGGTYYIAVDASPATATPTTGEYYLSVNGAKSGLPPFQVAATDVPDGSRFRVQPASIRVDFNDVLLLTTLQASDLKVDGVSATGMTVVDGDTVIFTLPGGLTEGSRSVTIAAARSRTSRARRSLASPSTSPLTSPRPEWLLPRSRKTMFWRPATSLTRSSSPRR